VAVPAGCPATPPRPWGTPHSPISLARWWHSLGAGLSPSRLPSNLTRPLADLRPPSPGFAFAEFIEKALTDWGVPFDRVNVDAKVTPKVNLATVLWNADGTPKYKGYAM
jgi:hypothetical protein